MHSPPKSCYVGTTAYERDGIMTANNPDAFLNKNEAELPDTVSDPALNDEVGQDWTDEGGATPSGAAIDGTES